MPRTLKFGRCGAADGRRHGETGSTLVEFAFVFMLFMAMVLGGMEFSRALYAYHFVSSAARQATRWAAVNGADCGNDSSCNGTNGMNSGPASSTDIQTYVTSHVPAGIDATKVTVNQGGESFWPVNADSPAVCAGSAGPPAVAPVPNAPGCTVQVKVSYDFNFLIPFVYDSPITLSSTSEMIIAH